MSSLIVPDNDIARLSLEAGWEGYRVVTAVAVCLAESGGDAHAVNVISNELRSDGTPNPAYHSQDIGLFQINTWWNSITTVEALTRLFDPSYNANFAHDIWAAKFASAPPTMRFTDKVNFAWTPWHAYTNGSYMRFWSRAVTAARAVGAIK